MRYFSNIIICLVFITSCDTKPDPEGRLSKTGIGIVKKYKLLKYKDDWAIGEFTETYTLLISKKDYREIVERIKKKPFFKKLDAGEIPKDILFSKITKKEKIETARQYDNKYFYQIFWQYQGIVISVDLEKDSLMHIYYENL